MASPEEERTITLWRATFAEFKRQSLRTFSSTLFDTESGDWLNVVGEAATAAADWSDLWPPQQWHIAFEILLCQAPPAVRSVLPGHDDLLMFVYWSNVAVEKGSRVFARRRGASLPSELHWELPLAAQVDWHSSLLLNVVLQTQYVLTVARCPPSELERIADGPAALERHSARSTRSIHVTKIVHASPSRAPLNLDQSRAHHAEPEASYPEICFAVDDFAEAFGELTVEESDDCYCVALHGDVAGSWGRAAAMGRIEGVKAGQQEQQQGEEIVSMERKYSTAGEIGEENSVVQGLAGLSLGTAEAPRADESPMNNLPSPPPPSQLPTLLFSGYVSHTQLTESLRDQLDSPLLGLQRSSRPTRVAMRGPGGTGRADVAVTRLQWPPEKEREGSRVNGGAGEQPGSLSPGKTVLRLMRGVVQAAQAAGRGGGGSGRGDSGGGPRLRCALMSLSMPVEALAEDILKAL